MTTIEPHNLARIVHSAAKDCGAFITEGNAYQIAKEIIKKGYIHVDDMEAKNETIVELLKALEHCYKVFKMDDVDTALSMQCGMAITKAKGSSK